MSKAKDIIYLDSAATTVLNHKALRNITSSMYEDWFNPSSIYESGIEVKRKIEHAREQVRELINAKPEDKIIFTSCSTELNNLAVQGFIKANSSNKTYILMDYMQHPSLYNLKEFIDFNFLEYNCEYLSLLTDQYGRIQLKSLEENLSFIKNYKEKGKNIDKQIKHTKVLVPIIHTNNETGVINDVKKISKKVHNYGGYVLVDAAQAIYHSPIDVQKQEIDMLTFTSEKIGLPRGVGVLYIRDGIDIEPIMYGGHQEYNGLRPGTENQYMIIALGKQCERIKNELNKYVAKENNLSWKLCRTIYDACEGVCDCKYNGVGKPDEHIDYSNNIHSVQFKGYNNQQLLTLLNQYGVCCSAGSACSSGESKPSRVLTSMGLSDEEAKSTLRFSFDNTLKEGDIDRFGKILRKCLIALK